MLKSYGVVGKGGGVAHEILVLAQGPLVFGFLCLGLRGLGPGLDNTYLYCHSSLFKDLRRKILL